MNFPQYLEKKYLEWQQVVGERKTVREFAEYIGVSASSITMWWKGKRTPEGENVQKIANKLGVEVYDVLGLPRPDPDLLYIQQNWSNISDKGRQAIREQAEKYKQANLNNEAQATSAKPKPRTT
jgi:transcriptional regulator with XRE-family HTH domain